MVPSVRFYLTNYFVVVCVSERDDINKIIKLNMQMILSSWMYSRACQSERVKRKMHTFLTNNFCSFS